jgi:hypothetical protein
MIILGAKDTEVSTLPASSVTVRVMAVGSAVIRGKAERLVTPMRIGLYVLVARSVDAVPPVGAWTEELNR